MKMEKSTFDWLEAKKGCLARYQNRTYKIKDWQIDKDGKVLLLGVCKQFENSLNYFTLYVFEEERFFKLTDLIN